MNGAGHDWSAGAGAARQVAMPVFDGAAEVVELLRMLYQRPRIGELPRREQGDRGHRLRRGLPMLCLVRPPGLEVLDALAGFLARTGQGRIPHAMLTLPAPEPPDERPAPTDELEAVRSILFALAQELGNGRNARAGRIRFRRFGLANWLLQQDVRDPDLEPDRVLLRRLRERSLAQRRFSSVSDEVQTELRNNLPAPWWAQPLLPLLRRVPPLWSAWKTSGRLPIFGATYRWFLRQPYLAPRDPGTFVGFAERLTIGIRDQEDTTQILKLLVNAFLEDLRRAYRRLPWRPLASRRTTYVVALLDGVRRNNSGYRILKLINDVRNETGGFDPLLLITGSAKLPPEALDPDSQRAQPHIWAARRARRGYQAWCNDFAAASRARTPTAWYLPIRVPAAHPQPDVADSASVSDQADSQYVKDAQELASTAPFAIDSAPPWARRAVLYPLVVVLALAAAGTGYLELDRRADAAAQWQREHCGQPRGKPGAELLISVSEPNDECIGVNEGWFSFFPEDPKLTNVMHRIEQQNRDVADTHAEQPSRRYVTLVYFSGLGAASAPEGLVAQREALAGVAAMQGRQLTGSGLLVRILVANGGAQMVHGERVARMLAELAAEDSSLVGVLGLGQSRQPTIDTIRELTAAGLPMIASALTADTIAGTSPMYYQVSPQNLREAALAAHYARTMPPGQLAPLVRIVQSNDSKDTYSRTLADDAEVSFAQVGFTTKPRVHYQPDTPPPPGDQLVDNAPAPSQVGSDTCGFAGLVFYAGRTQEFDSFLRGIHEQCRDRPPAILGGDDISRYVADRKKRTRYQSIPFDYISLAVGQPNCEGPSDLYTTLKDLFPNDCTGDLDPSLDGHAALAYDSTWTMITAVERLLNDGVQTITPAAVWYGISAISESDPLQGETGTIYFGGTSTPDGSADGVSDVAFNVPVNNVPVNKALAILRVTGTDNVRKPLLQAFCGEHGQYPAAPWCPAS